MTAFSYRQALRLLVLTIAGMFGCSMPPAAVGRSDEALLDPNVDWEINSCSANDRSYINQSLVQGRTAAVSPIFAACMYRSIVQQQGSGWPGAGAYPGPYIGCSGDPDWSTATIGGSNGLTQYRHALMVANSPNTMHISCSSVPQDDLGYTTQHDGQFHQNEESFVYGQWLQGVEYGSNPAGYQDQTASIAWHEVFHTHNYGHGVNSRSASTDLGRSACGIPSNIASFDFQKNTMPYLIGDCIHGTVNQGTNSCPRCFGNSIALPVAIDATSGQPTSECACFTDPAEWGAPLVAFYDTYNGAGAVGKLDITSVYRNLTYPGYASGWTHAVGLPHQRRFFYNTNTGAAAVAQYDNAGNGSTVGRTTLPTGYTHVVALPNEMVAFYNAAAGRVSFGRINDDGSYSEAGLATDALVGATQVAAAGYEQILLYKGSAGVAMTMYLPTTGFHSVQKNLTGLATIWDHVVGNGDGRLLFYSNSGYYGTGRIATDGSFVPAQQWQQMSQGGWTVATTMADGRILLFAPSRGELAVTRVDPQGMLYTEADVTGFSGQWTHMIGSR